MTTQSIYILCMTIEDIELELSIKLSDFLQEKTGKNSMLDSNWLDIENFIRDVITPAYMRGVENPKVEELRRDANNFRNWTC